MSTKTKAKPRAEAPELFSLEGKYQIAPGTTSLDLHNDIGGWLATAGATIDMVIDGMNYRGDLLAANPLMVTSVLYGVRQYLEMAQGALSASYKPEA